ncbi:MAG: hypothetical protein H8D45_14000 [Bacteroidetes bacterium]|nr:hypothetical protein [Bacteroidota bacterium]MBL7104561.1 hypothetical protein [Bacteroidales bacterium]
MNLLQYYTDKGDLIEVSVDELKLMLSDQTRKDEISDFIYKRHYYRYIKPFEYKSKKKLRSKKSDLLIDEYSLLFKNGFSVMANCCLLIETIESFYRGWSNSNYRSELGFLKFFTRDKNFKEFSTKDIPTEFYKNIRCGILHQGETTGGWSVTRTKEKMLDLENKLIDATLFHEMLKQSLTDFKKELEASDWNSPLWKNIRTKLKSIIKSTEK